MGEPVKEETTEKKEEKPVKGKGEKKEKPPKEKKEVKKEDEAPVDIGRPDLRVGHIRKATRHPNADSLYVEEILAPPPGCVPGDRVLVEGITSNPDPVLNPKKKVFETCAPDLQVNGTLQATYKGVLWTVSGKPVTAQSLAGVQIK